MYFAMSDFFNCKVQRYKFAENNSIILRKNAENQTAILRKKDSIDT